MFGRFVPEFVKKKIWKYRGKQKRKGEGLIFCISMQRTGTTSVGNFFKHFNFATAGWNTALFNQWDKKWYDGDFEAIFNSKDFLLNQVFEDSPWWHPEVYKMLYHRFPGSKFILFTRDSKSWFKSMQNHSGGKTLSNTRIHCKLYHRENEFYERLDNDPSFKPLDYGHDNLLDMEGWQEYYTKFYDRRNREVIEFFKQHDPSALFVGDLFDKNKWKNLGKFIGLDVEKGFEVHSNNSKAGK